MGMFDYVVCEYPIDLEKHSERLFQTKDTSDQCLTTYKITKEGELLIEKYDLEFPNRDNFELSPLERLASKKVNETWTKVNFTGEIRFYDVDEDENGFVFQEFSAQFLKGELQSIRRLS